jgi:hypothetical protein
MTDEEEYKHDFGIEGDASSSKSKEAFRLALDIRKFEIGLYWQRAAYCWALIAAAFAGYFAVLSADKLADKDYLAFVLGCIGLVFTWAWYLINRGSKFWQENWENHVDLLEDASVGPLYKTILHRPGNMRRSFVGPLPVSVSQVNLAVSVFTLLIWATLIAHRFPSADSTLKDAWRYLLVLDGTAAALAYMYFGCKTSFTPHTPVRKLRETTISDSDN